MRLNAATIDPFICIQLALEEHDKVKKTSQAIQPRLSKRSLWLKSIHRAFHEKFIGSASLWRAKLAELLDVLGQIWTLFENIIKTVFRDRIFMQNMTEKP